jgi:hypothetical protein
MSPADDIVSTPVPAPAPAWTYAKLLAVTEETFLSATAWFQHGWRRLDISVHAKPGEAPVFLTTNKDGESYQSYATLRGKLAEMNGRKVTVVHISTEEMRALVQGSALLAPRHHISQDLWEEIEIDDAALARFYETMEKLGSDRAGGSFTRDEANES